MTFDGVEFDGITFKDQLGLFLRGRIRGIKEQIGYKLSALLLLRRELPQGAREFLFGDDSESDAIIYALYADITAGRLRGSVLRRTLVSNGVEVDNLSFDLQDLAQLDAVRVAIHRP